MTLSEYLEENSLSVHDFAVKLGLDGNSRAITTRVQRWKDKSRTPPVDMLVRIEEVTRGKVTAHDFVTKGS